MDFDFPPDALMIRDMLRRFLQKEVRPLEVKYFSAGSLKAEERARLRASVQQMGLWGVMAPERFGGGGLDTISACLIEEELGGTFVPVDLGEVPVVLFACSGDQIQRYLRPALEGHRRAVLAVREPGALRPQAWGTTAQAGNDGYLLDGCKSLASLPGAEDFVVVFAKAPAGLTAFIVDANRPGMNLAVDGEILLWLRGCLVGPDAVLGEPGRALALGADEAPRAWIRAGARHVGMAERLLTMAAEHARTWQSLGAPLAARPATQRMLAEMRVDIEGARWQVYHAAWMTDQGKLARTMAAQVRLATAGMIQRAVDWTTMIFAGPGPSPQLEPQRLVRSAVPPEALELALDYARTAVASEVLAGGGGP